MRFYTENDLSFGVGYCTGDDVDALIFNIRLDTKIYLHASDHREI